MSKLRVLELFCGIGACSNVLEAILRNLLLETKPNVSKWQLSIYDLDVSNSKKERFIC